MPEIHPDNLREMHTQLTAAGIVEHAGIAFDTIRLEARVDAARDTILTLTRERDALREQVNAAHAALDEAGAPACDGVLSGRIAALAADLDQSNRSLGSAMWERDTLRAERDALRARLAERPCPPDPRDPPVSTAAEEAIERIWSALLNKASIERDDFATAASGDPAGELLDLADAVESALDKANEQIRTISEERGHAINLAMEQFRHRLYRT